MAADGEGQTVVEVVHARPRPAGSFAGLLSTDERERMARLRKAEGRDRFATAHALLRLVVARWIGASPTALVFGATCRHCGGPHGRPELRVPEGSGLHLSLSRSGPEVLVAVTRLGPVGVDGQAAVDVDFEGFDGVALAAAEAAAITALDPDRRPAARAILWARKEAVLKATGLGLMTDPSTVEVSPPFADARLVAWPDDDDRPDAIQIRDLELPSGAFGAVALLDDAPPDVRAQSGEELLDQV